jgi:RNA polymerase sigma-70 factor, ECF subfamily
MNDRDIQHDDLTLARQIAAGDEQALAEFYKRYAEPLFAFIYHSLGGVRADVEDLWQETLMDALKSIEGFSGQSRFFSWLCGIARHKVADLLRCRKRQVAVFSVISCKQFETLLEDRPLPEEILANREMRLRVVKVLAELPFEYRISLTARYAEQRSVEEVAKLLGKSYKAAESILSRAKAAFRTLLMQQDEDL